MALDTATTTTQDPKAADYKVADLGLAAFGRKEISLAEHGIGLQEVGFALRRRRERQLRDAVEAWFEAEAERPAHVPATDWLRFEQQKHSKLLAA